MKLNFIRLNSEGTIIDRKIHGLVATSADADYILIFADFDVSTVESAYRVTARCKRNDGLTQGPLDCILTQVTQEEADEIGANYLGCRKLKMTKPLMKVSGEMQITVSYHLVNENGIVIFTKAQPMFSVFVYNAVEELYTEEEYQDIKTEMLPRDLGDVTITETLNDNDHLVIAQNGTTKKISGFKLKKNIINNIVDETMIGDSVETKLETQIEAILNEKEQEYAPRLTNLEVNKADKTALQAVASGSPKGVFPTSQHLDAAFPYGNDNIYVCEDDGKWYYFDTGTGYWTAGGTYQSSGIADDGVTLSKRTKIGSYAKLAVDRPINFDLVNNKIEFPDSSNSIIFYNQSYYPIPRNLEIILDLSYGSGAVYFDTINKVFVSLRYGYAIPTYVFEHYILVFAITNNVVHIDCDYTINGNFPTFKRDRLDILSLGSNLVQHYSNTLNVKKIGQDIEIQILKTLWVYPNEKNEAFYLMSDTGVSNYTLPANSYDSVNKMFKFAIPHCVNLIANWIDKTVRVDNYTTFKNGDILLASCMEGELQSGAFRDIYINQQITKMGDALFNYSKSYIDDEIKIKKVAHAKKSGILRFAFMTDTHDHAIYRREYKFNILNKLAKTGSLDFICNGGDSLGYDTKDEVIEKLMDYHEIITNGITVPYFICKGNHDATGNIYSSADTSNILTDEEWHSTACCSLDESVVHDHNNPYGGYYYKDFNHAKIRVINLNTSQIGNLSEYFDPMNVLIQQSQIDWFQNVALNFMDKGTDKNSWSVIILSHAAINYVESGGLNGQQVIEGILNAYMTGSTYTGTQGSGVHKVDGNADFTSQGAMEFICAVNGHMHYDRVTTFATLNRPNISIGSAKSDMSEPEHPDAVRPSRTADTITDELADLFAIDTISRKIRTTRFGAGTDKEISY